MRLVAPAQCAVPFRSRFAERDQVQGFYDIVHDEVTKTEAHIRNIDHQMERMQSAHREDIRVSFIRSKAAFVADTGVCSSQLYLQKVIHLEYEHVHNVDTVNAEGDKQRKEEESKHHNKKGELKSGKLQLKQDLKEQVRLFSFLVVPPLDRQSKNCFLLYAGVFLRGGDQEPARSRAERGAEAARGVRAQPPRAREQVRDAAARPAGRPRAQEKGSWMLL
jgi:hypothetical protein